MIRILHAADLHLDSPFNALSEEKAALRRREQRELLRSLARIRAEQNASLVLLSGDLFDSDSTWAETEELLRLTLSEMAVPVFIAPGNHDYYAANGRWARMRLPENVPVFTSADFDAVVLEELSKMALMTRALKPGAGELPRHIIDKHFLRKHGPNAYYGQN